MNWTFSWRKKLLPESSSQNTWRRSARKGGRWCDYAKSQLHPTGSFSSFKLTGWTNPKHFFLTLWILLKDWTKVFYSIIIWHAWSAWETLFSHVCKYMSNSLFSYIASSADIKYWKWCVINRYNGSGQQPDDVYYAPNVFPHDSDMTNTIIYNTIMKVINGFDCAGRNILVCFRFIEYWFMLTHTQLVVLVCLCVFVCVCVCKRLWEW